MRKEGGKSMSGFDPERARRDVETIERNARYLIIIDPGNASFRVTENPRARLDVIAVVGVHDGTSEQAVLMEIGLWRTRPYHKSDGRDKLPRESYIPRREKQAVLSEEQYLLVAPQLFTLIQRITRVTVMTWKSPTHNIRINRVYLPGRRIKTLRSRQVEIPVPRGVRFTFSREDALLVRDIFWAEINGNKKLQYQLQGFSRFVWVALYSYIGTFNFESKKKFPDLKGVQAVQEVAEKWPLYLLAIALKKIDGSVRDWFYYDLRQLLGLEIATDPVECQVAAQAETLGDPSGRLGGIELLITTGLDAQKDYIVAEVFPSGTSDWEVSYSEET